MAIYRGAKCPTMTLKTAGKQPKKVPNRKRYRQTGSRQSTPPIDDTDPIRKFSIEPGSHSDLQNPAEFSPKGKPIRNFSIDPTSSIRTSIADAIVADAISETPRKRCRVGPGQGAAETVPEDPKIEKIQDFSETGRIRFRRVRFQTPNSVSFLGLTEFRGANSVSSSRPIICVPKRTHRVFRRTHRVCPKTQ